MTPKLETGIHHVKKFCAITPAYPDDTKFLAK